MRRHSTVARFLLLAVFCAIGWVILGALAGEDLPRPTAPGLAFHRTVNPFLHQYCTKCHGPDVQEGGVAFHNLQPDIGSETWERVRERLCRDEMPPEGEPHPPARIRRFVADWIARSGIDAR
jgi:mono/diheme cytochrome c family protein